MANWGIGLGGLAQGFERGVGIAKQLAGTPEEQRRRAAREASDEARTEFDAKGGGTLEEFQTFLLPKVQAKLVANGDLEGAKAWGQWATEDTNRRATQQFGQGMIAAQAGDTKTALDYFVKAGNTRGYGGDYKLSAPQAVDGGLKVDVTTPDGRQVAKLFKSPDEVMRFGATYLNPEAAFKQWQDQQNDARKRQADIEDDKTKYGNRKTIDTDTRRANVPIDVDEYGQKKKIDTEARRANVPIDVDEYGQKKKIDVDTKRATVPIEVDEYGQKKKIDVQTKRDMVPVEVDEYGQKKKIDTQEEANRTPTFLDRFRGQKDIEIESDVKRDKLGIRGAREHEPSEVKTAKWLIDNKIASSPEDAWNKVRHARENPEALRAQIFSRALTPQQGQKNWEAFLAAGKAAPSPAPGIGPPRPAPGAAPAPRPAAQAAPAEIKMKGNGTQAAPYQPASKADYDEMPSGTYYLHPSDGKARIKK